MSNTLASFYITGNFQSLQEEIARLLKSENFSIEENPEKESDYRLYVFEVSRKTLNSSTEILDKLAGLKNYTGKVCIVFSCQSNEPQRLIEQAQALVRPYLSDPQKNVRLIHAYDLYSNSATPLSNFHSWICEVAKIKKALVSGTQANHLYPTSVEDVYRLVIKSLFVTSTSGEVFVAASEDTTDLEVAYLLKKSLEKNDQKLEINLDSKEKENLLQVYDLSVQTQALLNWIPKISLSERLDEIVSSALEKDNFEVEPDNIEETNPKTSFEGMVSSQTDWPKLEKLERREPEKKKFSPFSKIHNLAGVKIKDEKPAQKPHQFEKRSLTKLIIIALVTILFLISLPLIVSAGSLYLSSKETYASYQAIRVGDQVTARKYLTSAIKYHNLAENTFRSVATVAEPLAEKEVIKTNNFLLILGHSQDVLSNVLDTYSLGDQLYQGIIGKQPVDQKAVVGALKINLISLTEKLSQIQLLIEDVELPFGYEVKLDKETLTEQIALLKSQISSSIPLLDLSEKFLTNQTVQRYLILVQDENELRPGGGFLSTYAIMTLDQGSIIDFQADSSLSFDRLIEGQVEPPSVIKKLTGQTNWLFHDSNLSPDFSVNARQASWFYERFRGHKVDGVIGLNLSFFKFILDEIGEISLEGGQQINSDNVNSLASNPTSSNGLDVITQATKALGEKLISGEVSFALTARAILKTVIYDEIQVWFENRELQSLSEDAGIGGVIEPLSCHPQISAYNCQTDTVYLNEANFSVNKINYYLKRQSTYAVSIGDSGEINYSLSFDYSYPVPAPTNFGQIYQAYYQFYYPTNGKSLSITLDGQPLPENQQVRTDLGNGLTKVDFSSNQSLNQSHKLNLTFISSHLLNLRSPQSAYSLGVLKQPGTLEDTQIIQIKYPVSLQPRIITVPMKQVGSNELVLHSSPIGQENVGILFKNQNL